MENLGLNLGYLLVQIFNFAILFVIFRAWIYKPLMGMLEKRKEAIANGLEDARIAAEARANAEKDAGKILADAQKKASEIVAAATERAEAASREVRANTEAELSKQRQAMLDEVQEERNRILGELRNQIAALSIAAAQKLVGEALMKNEEHQHALLNEFFSGVKSGKVVVLDTTAVSGTTAEVTSALPLTTEEQQIVKKDLLVNLGDAASVSFRVDPSILGGLVLKVGDQVIDGSVAGQLQELRKSL